MFLVNCPCLEICNEDTFTIFRKQLHLVFHYTISAILGTAFILINAVIRISLEITGGGGVSAY